ncbi:hypothetical protein AB6846_05820 [Serratia proteamaculans]
MRLTVAVYGRDDANHRVGGNPARRLHQEYANVHLLISGEERIDYGRPVTGKVNCPMTKFKTSTVEYQPPSPDAGDVSRHVIAIFFLMSRI